MNRVRRAVRSADRGFTLVEVVVGLALAALGAALAAWTLAAATERAVPADDGPYAAALAADTLARDVREAAGVEVVTLRAGAATELQLATAGGTVRWTLTGAALNRLDPVTSIDRTMVADLDPSGRFLLVDGAGAAIDPADPAAVRDCTRLVGFDIADRDGAWALTRTVALRLGDRSVPCA